MLERSAHHWGRKRSAIILNQGDQRRPEEGSLNGHISTLPDYLHIIIHHRGIINYIKPTGAPCAPHVINVRVEAGEMLV